MIAEIPNIDDPGNGHRSLPGKLSKNVFCDGESVGLPVSRMGLEQEFFLVDLRGEPRDLADVFLWGCREEARAEGLDPRCFQTESVMGLVEITTPPSHGAEEMARHYLANLGLALGVASELGLALYPLGTYPLPINPAVRDDPRYALKANTIGRERFAHAGRCAGTHLHLELPAGTVWPDIKAALKAPLAAQRELLDLYNLATALDPALVALTRACPFYQGEVNGFAARTIHYRGILGFEGVYAGLREVGGLSAYASRVEDLVDQQRARYKAWFAAMDLAGVERRLFAQAGGNVHRASWNPVRLSHHGTVEIRTMDANFPETVLGVSVLIRGAAERVRHERLEVRPSRGVLTLEPDGELLRVPVFSYLRGELLGAAATSGVQDPRIEAYLDSLFAFACPYLEEPGLVEPLASSGGYQTTEESALFGHMPPSGTALTRDRGLSLVRQVCRRLEEQVSSLGRRFDATLPADRLNRGATNPRLIRGAWTISAGGAAPERGRSASIGKASEQGTCANAPRI